MHAHSTSELFIRLVGRSAILIASAMTFVLPCGAITTTGYYFQYLLAVLRAWPPPVANEGAG